MDLFKNNYKLLDKEKSSFSIHFSFLNNRSIKNTNKPDPMIIEITKIITK